MKRKLWFIVVFAASFLVYIGCLGKSNKETVGNWVKYKDNPVLGGKFGTIFDVSVLREPDGYVMYCSWRPQKSIAVSKSEDGFHWGDPQIVLGPDSTTGWEDELNRPVVVKREDGYHMWYTGQMKPGNPEGTSDIGYAVSPDGINWQRMSEKPVLSPQLPWEKHALMCPHVMWDKEEGIYKMWYSGGEQYEPDAIGYATSKDGMTWEKYPGNPVFANDPENDWEKAKVTACQVMKNEAGYTMFYIGFHDVDFAQIGMARSKDGINNWERYKDNPIIKPGPGWDSSAVYKPFTIFDGTKWLLWYNGRRNNVEQIGVAIHQGKELGF